MTFEREQYFQDFQQLLDGMCALRFTLDEHVLSSYGASRIPSENSSEEVIQKKLKVESQTPIMKAKDISSILSEKLLPFKELQKKLPLTIKDHLLLFMAFLKNSFDSMEKVASHVQPELMTENHRIMIMLWLDLFEYLSGSKRDIIFKQFEQLILGDLKEQERFIKFGFFSSLLYSMFCAESFDTIRANWTIFSSAASEFKIIKPEDNRIFAQARDFLSQIFKDSRWISSVLTVAQLQFLTGEDTLKEDQAKIDFQHYRDIFSEILPKSIIPISADNGIINGVTFIDYIVGIRSSFLYADSSASEYRKIACCVFLILHELGHIIHTKYRAKGNYFEKTPESLRSPVGGDIEIVEAGNFLEKIFFTQAMTQLLHKITVGWAKVILNHENWFNGALQKFLKDNLPQTPFSKCSVAESFPCLQLLDRKRSLFSHLKGDITPFKEFE